MNLRLTPVRQQVPRRQVNDIEAVIRQGLAALPLAATVKPGMRIAVAVGSRGITDITKIVGTVIRELQALDAQPFLVPAMGSHGGGTAEGQRSVFEGYGLDQFGVPILSDMEAQQIGTSAQGMPVFFDRNAAQADGIIAINRIKEHTAFKAPLESGLCKILTVGLGKRAGAAVMHRYGIKEAIPDAARVVFDNMPIIAGVGILEDGYHQTADIAVLRAAEIMEREPDLLNEARRLLPRIPIEPLDLLVIQEMGKDISGTGIDLNVIGMWRRTGGPVQPKIETVAVLDLTANSHGNAIGVGHADLITQRLYDKIDVQATYLNCLTSRNLAGAKIPITLPTDREVIETGLAGIPDPAQGRMIIIRNTLELNQMWVTDTLLPEIEGKDELEIVGASEQLEFDESGRLIQPEISPVRH